MELKPVGMWVTPKSQEELMEMVEEFNNPEAIHAMMFTWNYIAHLLKEEADEESGQDSGGRSNVI